MILFDSHVHTSFSTDSQAPMESMVLQAIQNGLKGIIFTDHMDYNFPKKYDWDTQSPEGPFTFDLDSYLRSINDLKEKYKDEIEVCPGVEIGLKNDAYDKNVALSHNDALDYVIGSTHLIENIDPYYPEYWEMYEENKGIQKYFDTTLDNLLNLGDIRIDSIGHLDYIVRYSPSGSKTYRYSSFSEVIDEILHVIIDKEISLEINTSGYEKSGNMPNPNFDIIKRYQVLGGKKITFGSDAHSTDRIGKRFEDAKNLAKEAGFNYYTTFSKRKPIMHTL